jgi:hypothetical protein
MRGCWECDSLPCLAKRSLSSGYAYVTKAEKESLLNSLSSKALPTVADKRLFLCV